MNSNQSVRFEGAVITSSGPLFPPCGCGPLNHMSRQKKKTAGLLTSLSVGRNAHCTNHGDLRSPETDRDCLCCKSITNGYCFNRSCTVVFPKQAHHTVLSPCRICCTPDPPKKRMFYGRGSQLASICTFQLLFLFQPFLFDEQSTTFQSKNHCYAEHKNSNHVVTRGQKLNE